MRCTFNSALSLAMAMALAACNSEADDPATRADAAASASPAPAAPASPVVEPSASPSPDADIAAGIPAAMHGSWGLNRADCAGGAAAKGLLEVDGTTLTFYESRGTLGEVEERDDRRLRAGFAFTGEGMTWQRDMTLELQEDGQVLVRSESGDDAAPGPLRYTRCS